MTSLPLWKTMWGIDADGHCRSNPTDPRAAVVEVEANLRRCHMRQRREVEVVEAGRVVILVDECCRRWVLHSVGMAPHFHSYLMS